MGLPVFLPFGLPPNNENTIEKSMYIHLYVYMLLDKPGFLNKYGLLNKPGLVNKYGLLDKHGLLNNHGLLCFMTRPPQ